MSEVCFLAFHEVLNKLQLFVVLFEDFLRVTVLVALFVDAFALATEAFLIFVLFVIYVFLEAIVHFQS